MTAGIGVCRNCHLPVDREAGTHLITGLFTCRTDEGLLMRHEDGSRPVMFADNFDGELFTAADVDAALEEGSDAGYENGRADGHEDGLRDGRREIRTEVRNALSGVVDL